MDGMMEKGGPPPQRLSAKRKLRAVSRLLRGEPLELVARERNVTAARGCRNGGSGHSWPPRRR